MALMTKQCILRNVRAVLTRTFNIAKKMEIIIVGVNLRVMGRIFRRQFRRRWRIS